MTGSDTLANHFLFIAHPGHELCVYGWLSRAQPKVFVLTDGSGHGSQPRINSTSRVLAQVGAQPGSIYGRFTDAELYDLILKQDFQPLLQLAEEFANALVSEQPNAVAGDAIEGYNPAHDLCRLIINAAVTIARRSRGEIINRDFLLAGRHVESTGVHAINLDLDEKAFTQKLKAAHEFPELQFELQAALTGDLLSIREYPQLKRESRWLDHHRGAATYQTEVLRPADQNCYEDEFPAHAPFYERYGELRVADGFYSSVIRYREHMLPLAHALRRFAEG